MTHEINNCQYKQARDAVFDTMKIMDVNVTALRNMSKPNRLACLLERFSSANVIHNKPSNLDRVIDGSKSIALIKPEVFPHDEIVINELLSRGYKINEDPKLIYPSEEQWMKTYGYMVPEHPDILQNYILHRALGLKVLTLVCMDEVSIGHLNNETGKATKIDNTIRGGVIRNLMINLGFNNMQDYASAFDPLDLITSNKDTNYVFKCYNGIHTPANQSEAAVNMETFYVK